MTAIRFALDHGRQPTAGVLGPRHQAARVAGIRPDDRQPGRPAPQFGQYQLGAVPIPVSRHGADFECWRHELPTASSNPMVSTIRLRRTVCVPLPVGRRRNPEAPVSVVFTDRLSMMAALGVASRPAASRTRRASSTRSQVRRPATCESTTTPCPRAVRLGRMGQHPPGYAAAQHVQDAVYHLPESGGSGMASFRVGRRQGNQFLPLGIGQVDGIRFSAHVASVTTFHS